MLEDHTQGGGDGDNGRCEAVGDRRETSSHQRLFCWSSCANKEAFFECYLPEASPADILTVPMNVID